MNKIHRVLWNKATQTFVAVAEIVASSGKGATRSTLCSVSPGTFSVVLRRLCASLAGIGWCWSAALAQGVAPTQLPVGGQVVAGSVRMGQSNATLTINQSSSRAAINWQSFHVGAQAKVNILQPSSSSVLLNRVLGNSASQIMGQISANGQVIVSNPSGMYFSPTAAVDVHSFTATTHGISDADFMAGIMKFTRQGASGKIVNEGQISAGLGGYVALLAPDVRNSGLVVAKMGTVALASGEAYELEFDQQQGLANILVSPSTVAALVDNGRAVHAPGGLIILSAQAANQLHSGVVKNSGTLQASGLVNQGGVIRLSASQRIVNTGSLLADAAPNSPGDGGTITVVANLSNANSRVDVGGTLSARGGDLGGHGGFVETSASQVQIQDSARVITLSPKGKAGTWLVDPIDFSIDSGLGSLTSSGIGAGTLENNLANTSVSISTDNVASGSGGDLNVNASVTWSANTTLTLSAYKNVNVNAALTATGVGGGLNITAKAGGSSGAINLGANVTTGGQQVYNGNVSLSGSDIGLTSTAGGISIVGGVTPNVGGSNFTVASETAGNVTGVIAGNTKLIKAGNGVLALKGGNTYTGGTDLNGGAVRLDHASGTATNATNALGPSGLISFSGGALQFTTNNTVDYSTRFKTTATQLFAFDTNGQNVTLANLPAGSGTLTKSGNGTLMLTNASTRFGNATVGATVVNGGGLTLAVAHPSAIVSQAVFSGAGSLNIEPVATSFNGTTTTSSDLLFSTGGSTLGGFNLGKTGNTANITLDSLSGISVSGNQGYFGGNVTLSAAATPTFTSWSNGATLTLSGINTVNILAPISVTNANSSIAIKTSQNTVAGSNVGYYNFGLSATGFSGRIDFSGDPGQTFTTQDGTNAANLKTYTFITTLDALRTSSASANLALRTDIDAASYVQAGGNPYTAVRDGSFTGNFAGLGHTISNLSIRGSGVSYAGLFSQIGAAVVQDIRFERATITGINMNYLGTLAGYANNAKVSGIMVANGSVNISSSGSWAGGVLGFTEGGAFQDAWVSNTSVAAISGGVGGILGRSLMSITNVHNLGSDVRSNGGEVGGLVGQHWNAQSLSLSHATGNVTGGGSYVGGLVGQNWGPITDSYAMGNVTGNLTNDYGAVGGAVGRLYASNFTNVTASGNVLNRYGQTGGLIGFADQGVALTNVSAAGTVRSQSSSSIGGLVGYSNSVLALSNATYSGTSVVSTGSVEGVGGLIGYVQESVSIANSSVGNAGARVNISSTGAAGGLVGWARNGITITDSNVSNADISGGTYVGGLVGEQRRGSVQINRSFAGGGWQHPGHGWQFCGGAGRGDGWRVYYQLLLRRQYHGHQQLRWPGGLHEARRLSF